MEVPTFAGLTADAWQAVAAMGTLLVAVAAAVVALLQVSDARRIRREQSAPYVIVQLEQSQAAFYLFDLVVKNVGTTPAHHVTIEIDPPMERAKVVVGYPFMDSKLIRDPIQMIAPGQEFRLFFDDVRNREGNSLPSEFHVTVNGFDSRQRPLEAAEFTLDLDWGRGGVFTEVRNMHWIGARIKGIETAVASIAASLEK